MASYGALWRRRRVPQPLPALAEPVSFGGDVASLFFALWSVRWEKPCSFPRGDNLRGRARSFCEFANEKLVDAGRSFNGAEEFVCGDARWAGPGEPVAGAEPVSEAAASRCHVGLDMHDGTISGVVGVLADKEN